MSETPSNDDGTVAIAVKATAVLGVALAAALGVVVGPAFGATALGGALLGAGNLWVLSRTVRAFLSGAAGLPWVLVALGKFFVLFGGVVTLASLGLDPLALVLGVGAVPLGIVAAQLRASAAHVGG